MPNNVLSNDPRGPESRDKAAILRPEVTVIFRASALPGETEWLAWVSSANNVALDAGECADVVMDGDAWPVLSEDGPAVGVDLAEGDGTHSGSFKPEAETADPAEEVEDTDTRYLSRGFTLARALRARPSGLSS